MPFLNDRRRRVYPPLLTLLAFAWISLGIAFLWTQAAHNDTRYGGDFVVFWSAGNLAEDGRPADVFDYAELHAEERKLLPETELYPWHYPPLFLAMVRPFAAFSYTTALVLWTALGAGSLAVVLWKTGVRSWEVPALSLAGVTVNTVFGQNALFSASILGGGLCLLEKRPFMAGVVLGMLAYKPHFLPCVVLLLVATRQWRALAGLSTSAAAGIGITLWVFGPDIWTAFIDNSRNAANSLYEAGSWEKMPSVVASAQLLGLPKFAAQAGQAAFSLAVLAGLLWVIRSGASQGTRNAAVVVASVAVSPYVFVYDLAILAPGFAWLLTSTLPRQRWEQLALAAVAGLPLVCWGVAASTGIPVGPPILAATMAAVVAQARRERATAPEMKRQPGPRLPALLPQATARVATPD